MQKQKGIITIGWILIVMQIISYFINGTSFTELRFMNAIAENWIGVLGIVLLLGL